MNKQVLALTAAAAALALAGCVSDQDGDGTDTRQGLNGLAVDGRVAGGKVWADMNNNNRVDDFEPYAYTDSDGYYGYNPLLNTNYCALPVISDEYQRHCLIYGASTDSIVIRIKGGTDLSTGEKLKGVMAMGTTISDSSQPSSTPLVLSPITTLLSSADTTASQSSFRQSLGISSDDDLRIDFSDLVTNNNAKARKFLANSVAVQTMMDVLVSSADDGADSTTNELEVIKQISAKVAAGSKPPTDLDDTDLGEVIKMVTANTTKQSSVSARLKDLNAVIKAVENESDQTLVNSQLKAAEVVSQLVKKEAKGDDSDAIKKVLDSSTTGVSDLATKLKDSMADASVEYDITTVTNSLVDAGKDAVTNDTEFDDTTITSTVTDAVNDSKLASDTNWGGKWFVLKATADDTDELAADSYIAIYLGGTADSTKGSIGTCVNVSPSLNEGETADPGEVYENEYLGGRWTKISGGMISLTFDYEGQELDGTMKAKAFETGQPQLYRFSSDIDGVTEQGDLELNVNAVSALANVSKPASASDCATRVDTQL